MPFGDWPEHYLPFSRESSALHKVVHDWHYQKCRDNQTQKAELLPLPVGGLFLSTAGRAGAACASQQTGSEAVRYWICKHDAGKQRPF